MIDSPLYKELMVTDGSPDEKIISGVWGGPVWDNIEIFDFEDAGGGC